MGPLIAIPIVFVAVLVVLVVGSTFFRAAVAVANKVVGPVKPSASLAWDWEAAEDDEEFEEINRKLQAIPEPGLGQGMLIVLVVGVVQFLTGFVLSSLFELGRWGRDDFEDVFPVLLIDGVAGFSLMAAMVSSMLPTTGRRAALATFFFYLITITVGALIFGVIAFVLRSTGP